ncbi:hypothetical protein MTO96_033313 [Rhipicephalus appendiculatus]
MFAANSAFVLIIAVTITMITISSTTTWYYPNGRCKSVGVRCSSGNNNTCRGMCTCEVILGWNGYYERVRVWIEVRLDS